MLEIAFGNVWSYVRGPRDEVKMVIDHLTYFAKGARYSLAYKQGRWDGKKSFFNARYQSFPTGLLPEVIKRIKKEKIEYKLGDRRDEKQPIEFQKPNLAVELRDYQKRAIEALLKHKRGICKLSTRSGKTVIGITCTQILGLPTLFVVHTKDLLRQTVDEYREKANIDPGVIGEGTWNPQFVTVATIQSLNRALTNNPDALEFIESREFVIFDEVHRASEMYQKVAQHLRAARYRLGLSATALISGKENRLASMALTGPLIYEVRMKELVDVGRIVKPKIYFLDIEDEIWGDDWNAIYDNGIVNHATRNMAIAYIAIQMKKRKDVSSLILVEKLEHGDNIIREIGDHIHAEYVSGSDSSQTRLTALSRLQSGEIDALISTRIFNEGIDIPYLESVIVASGYKSAIQSYQKYGRGITKVENKDKTIIWDFTDKSHDLLWGHSEERIALCQRDEAFEIHRIQMAQLLSQSFWEGI